MEDKQSATRERESASRRLLTVFRVLYMPAREVEQHAQDALDGGAALVARVAAFACRAAHVGGGLPDRASQQGIKAQEGGMTAVRGR
eukprot:2398067-Pleurochrysis_carterae.AAC.3